MVALLFRQHSMLSVRRILSTGKRRGIQKVAPSFRRAALAWQILFVHHAFFLAEFSKEPRAGEERTPGPCHTGAPTAFYVWTCPWFGLLTGSQKVIRHPREGLCPSLFSIPFPEQRAPHQMRHCSQGRLWREVVGEIFATSGFTPRW